MRTLSLLANSAKIVCDIDKLSITYHLSSPEDFFAHLREMANSQPDAVALARLMPNKAVEKFDDFAPEELLDEANAQSRLDILGAVEAGKTILLWEASGEVILTASDTQTLNLAVELQVTASGGPSFVDCLVMAHADQQQTQYVFGFDATFQKNGYKLPGK